MVKRLLFCKVESKSGPNKEYFYVRPPAVSYKIVQTSLYSEKLELGKLLWALQF